MKRKLILRSRSNEILQDVRDCGLDPSEFIWTERNSTRCLCFVSVLVHQPTGYYFMFDWRDESHCAEHYPAAQFVGVEMEDTGTWMCQRKAARRWLNEVKAPDRWAMVAQQTELAKAAAATDAPNTPFTPEEQEYISARLGEIETHLIGTQSLSDEHTEFVRTRLNYLDEAAKRQGRQDWLHTTIGVLFTIAIGVTLAPQETRELFGFVANALRQLLNGILPVP